MIPISEEQNPLLDTVSGDEFSETKEMVTPETEEVTPYPRGQTPVIAHIDEAPYIPSSKIEKPIPDYYNPFVEVTDATIVSDRDLTQKLPGVDVTDEELETLINLCEKAINENPNATQHRKTLENLINVFYHVGFNTHGDKFKSFFTNNEGHLTQLVKGLKGGSARIAQQAMRIDDNAEVLSGKTVLQYLNKITHTGNTVKVPLWHSGLIFTIDPFSEKELLNLSIALETKQIQIGADTRGAIFTGDDIHIVGTIVEFILSHVSDVNLKGFTRSNLNKLIVSKDIPTLMAGALAAIYPSGYPVFHPCVNTANGLCSYNITPKRKPNNDYVPDSLLDFTKVIMINFDKIDDFVNLHMTSGKTYTYAEIQDYQEKLTNLLITDTVRSVIYKGTDYSISAVFKTPTFAEYTVSANMYVNNIKQMVEKTISPDMANLGEKNRAAKRKELLDSFVNILNLTKHSSWISSFIITESNGIERIINNSADIKNADDVIAALETFAKLDGFTEDFEKAIQQYKEDTTIAWSGIPNFECPVCHKGQVDPGSKTPTLIPLNMVGYFFSTMDWRHQMRH